MTTPTTMRERFELRYKNLIQATTPELKEELLSFIQSEIDLAVEKREKEIVGEIGARLLAKHSPQIVLDTYFDVANELLEENENNN